MLRIAPLNLGPEATLCPGGGGEEENRGPRLSLWDRYDTKGPASGAEPG